MCGAVQVIAVITHRFFDDARLHRLVDAVAQADIHAVLVNFRSVDQAVNSMLLDHLINFRVGAVHHDGLCAGIDRVVDQTAGFRLAIGEVMALLGGIGDIKFHLHSRIKSYAPKGAQEK